MSFSFVIMEKKAKCIDMFLKNDCLKYRVYKMDTLSSYRKWVYYI